MSDADPPAQSSRIMFRMHPKDVFVWLEKIPPTAIHT